MDTNIRVKINIDEVRSWLHKLGHQIPNSDVQILMEAVSTNYYIYNFFSITDIKST